MVSLSLHEPRPTTGSGAGTGTIGRRGLPFGKAAVLSRPFWVISIAFALRLLSLRPDDLGLDGDFSLTLVWIDLPQMLALTARDTHPPFYYLLLRWWTELAGSTAFAARYLGIALSTASVAVLYALGRRAAGGAVGLVAALLLALSALHLHQTVTVRDFVAGLFFELIALYCFLRLVRREDAPRARGEGRSLWLGFVAASLAALYTTYLYAGAFLGLGLYVALRETRPALWQRWLPATAAITAGYLPWLLFALAPLGSTVITRISEGSDHPPPGYSLWDLGSGHLPRSFLYLLSGDYLPLPPWTYAVFLGALALWA